MTFAPRTPASGGSGAGAVSASGHDHLGGRLPLLDVDSLGAEQRDFLAYLESNKFPWAKAAGFTARLDDGRAIGPFNAQLHSPDVSQAFNDWSDAESLESTLSSETREIVMLTVAAVWRADYGLYAHRAVAKTLGSDSATIDAIVAGEEPLGAPESTRMAWRFTRELVSRRAVSDELYSRARDIFGVRGLIDIVNLIGVRLAMASQLNAFRVPAPEDAGSLRPAYAGPCEETSTSFVRTSDGTQIFFKDWGEGQPIVFHHGWPLSSDDWDCQMLFFLRHGYRVVAHDRRGHGRSSQGAGGHDMDTYAADTAAVVDHLGLDDAIHIGHSTGGGVVARYIAKFGKGRVAKAVLVSAVSPIMLKSDRNPDGTPIELLDGLREQLAANRARFYRELPVRFYGFNREGATVDEAVIDNWWRQGMTGSALAHYQGIKAFSETDQTDDLAAIDVPVLILQGDDDQIVPYKAAALLQAKLMKHAALKIYQGFPHGMQTTHAEVINADILAFLST